MAWLWLISVGVTDVQFPVWEKNVYGQWTGPWRFEIGRAGVRGVHQGLLALLNSGQIEFGRDLPQPIARNIARDLRLDFVQEDRHFLASIQSNQSENYYISHLGNEIPNNQEQQLTLYCPKVEALLAEARATFANNPVTVVVLNTRRGEDFSEARDEPIASGPLVAKYLAEQLGLSWLDNQGAVPEQLVQSTSTWVDLLTGNEAMEDQDVQQQIVKRLTAIVRNWSTGTVANPEIMVTTSGGMPPLKPIIERVPATCLGPRHVRLLDRPERGPAAATVLNYDARVAEQEVLRFYCADALRKGDYTGAYGLANRFPDQPWATHVRNLLGPLLELPGGSLQFNGRPLESFALSACQIEISLCMDDISGALKRLSLFIESSVWTLIEKDARISRLKLKIKHDDECLVGKLNDDHELFTKKLLELNSKGNKRHGVLGLSRRWPPWLAQPAGNQVVAASALEGLRILYNDKPRQYRNRLVHGSSNPVTPNEIKDCLKSLKLIVGTAKPFGKNFLAVQNVKNLLDHRAPNLASEIGTQLTNLLNRVIEG